MIRLAQWLGVIAVLVRTVFGPGLMPDLQAAARGEFKLVICTGSGTKVLPRTDQTDDTTHAGDGMCPFSIVTLSAAPIETAALLVADLYPALSPAVLARPLLIEFIPAFGARAPPTQS